MTATKELRTLSKDDRVKALAQAQDDLMHERGLAAMGGAVKNPGKIRELRRTIARILTIGTESARAPRPTKTVKRKLPRRGAKR